MIGAFIIVRLSSSHLPQIAIRSILDNPMIELMVERVRKSCTVDMVVIATSTETLDGPLEELAGKIGVCSTGTYTYCD